MAEPPGRRKFGALGALLLSIVPALFGTVAFAIRFDISWVWWLPIYMSLGTASFCFVLACVYLRKG
ncbi:MAG: hypothetical protein AAFY35_09920 [Pseudomonadota bacterium]